MIELLKNTFSLKLHLECWTCETNQISHVWGKREGPWNTSTKVFHKNKSFGPNQLSFWAKLLFRCGNHSLVYIHLVKWINSHWFQVDLVIKVLDFVVEQKVGELLNLNSKSWTKVQSCSENPGLVCVGSQAASWNRRCAGKYRFFHQNKWPKLFVGSWLAQGCSGTPLICHNNKNKRQRHELLGHDDWRRKTTH